LDANTPEHNPDTSENTIQIHRRRPTDNITQSKSDEGAKKLPLDMALPNHVVLFGEGLAL
jgi:hypothetical protein